MIFRVEVGYRYYNFFESNDALSFAIMAKKYSENKESVSIEIIEQEEEEDD